MLGVTPEMAFFFYSFFKLSIFCRSDEKFDGVCQQLQNALPHISRQSIRAAIKKLIDQHYLVSCSCTVRDRKSEKHKISYYKLTGKAVSDIFPSLFLQSDLAFEYLILHPFGPEKAGPLTPYVRDSYTINRLCRIIECEQFCSAPTYAP